MKIRNFLSLGAMAVAVFLLGCHHQMNAENPRKAERQTISIEVTVPDPAWGVTIEEVHATTNRLLVVSSLHRDPDRMAAQVISRVRDEVKIEAPNLPVEHYVLGKTFGWADDPHHFIENRKELEKRLQGARLLYKRPKS